MNNRRTLLATLFFCLTLLPLTGCGGAPKAPPSNTPTSIAASNATATATPAELPSGWARVASKDAKMMLALPGEWIVANSDNPEFTKAMEDIKKNNPKLPTFNDREYYFLAFSTKPKNDFSDNVNIIKRTAKSSIPMTEASVRELESQLPKVLPLAGPVTVKIVQLGPGSAFRYETSLNFKAGPGKKDFQTYIIGYMIFVGTEQYTITFSTTPASKDGFGKLTDEAMKHFHFPR